MKSTDASIQKRAAEWLALREARGFTAAEHAAFAGWCAADPRHARVFAEVESAWRTFDQLAAYPHSDDVAPDPDLLATASRKGRQTWVAIAGLTAAACLAIVAALSRQTRPAPTSAASVAGTIEQVGPRVLHLSDGSEVELNTASEVRERFTATERRVQLVRGEAHFTVAKNMERPFVVEAGMVAVRAVGTAFNVRLEAVEVEVLVTEGRVQVSLPASVSEQQADRTHEAPATLTAGQRTVVPSAPAPAESAPRIETLTPSAVDKALAWQSRRLVFDATPLAEVVARINAHSGGERGALRLSVGDRELAAMRISGRIRPENIESFVEVLEANFGVRAERRANGETVLLRR